VQEHIRLLAQSDCADVAVLEAAARAAMTDQRGGLARLGEVAVVGDWAPLVAENRVWVGTIDDVVVGYLELTLQGSVAEVRQVYVDPQARELGFGDGMLAAATEAAIAAGCTVLEGTALPGDRHTKNLYERAGSVARKIVVSTPLSHRT
jgi:GNAT superfamily N-acetyltransferase